MNDEDPQPIECRAAVEISPTATNEILFLPIGLHAITPISGGIGRPIKVKVGPESAQAIEAQRASMSGKGKRAYFDFNHEDGPASFWPDHFMWKPGEGVIACGEWSKRGRNAVEGKDYRAFSPVFHVDNKRAEAATVVCKETADPNMGGLVNNPAFKDLPLWAKNAEQLGNAGVNGDNEGKKGETEMTNEELAALRAKHQELEGKVAALEAEAASNAADETIQAKRDAGKSDLRAMQLEIQTEELRARSQVLEDQVRSRNKKDAESEVKAAIQRGAILPKDMKTQNELIARATADPGFKDVIRAMQGNSNQLSTRITGGYVSSVNITAEAPSGIYTEMSRILATSSRSQRADKVALSREFSAIYAREISPITAAQNSQRNLSMQMFEIESAIKAADVTDADLGTLSGTLVTQRTLELLKFQFPALSRFTTDFSDTPAQFNQTIMTRTVGIPAVTSYNTTTGWAASTVTDHDVPIVISAHRGVEIRFNENILASTVRRLFDEHAPAQAYALGKDFMDALYANITTANFPNNQVTVTTAFGRSALIDLGVALNLLGVPNGAGMRTALLYSTAFGNLEKDAAIVSLGTFRQPSLITGPTQENAAYIIDVAGFGVIDAPNLPSNNANLTGFAGSKSALVIATRVPNDYTAAMPGASYGNVQMVSDPDIGITVMLVQYVNHQLGNAASRIALMYGTAAGQSNAGMLLKSVAGSGSAR